MSRWTLSGIALLCTWLLAACGARIAWPTGGGSQHAVALPAATTTPLPTIQAPPPTGPAPGATPEPARSALEPPPSTPYPDTRRFSLGQSAEGRELWAWRFGDGPHRIVLVGGIHGGYEANTARLAELIVRHFRLHPPDVLPGIQLVVIPAANPDGLARGEELEGRFNANGVDLNRNWGCGWSTEAILHDIPVDPGPRPFSEPETQALRAYFIAEEPEAVIFYHSAMGKVFMGACGPEHPPAAWMGDLLAAATGYPYTDFTHYDVTGDATNWLAERGIPAAVVELYTRTEPELSRNLAGVNALQCAIALRDRLPEQLDEPLRQAAERLCQ